MSEENAATEVPKVEDEKADEAKPDDVAEKPETAKDEGTPSEEAAAEAEVAKVDDAVVPEEAAATAETATTPAAKEEDENDIVMVERFASTEDENAEAPTEEVEATIPGKTEDEIINELVETVQKDYHDATPAECRRFVRASRNEQRKKKPEVALAEAEKLLENYLDWRSCFGLDFDKDKTKETNIVDTDEEEKKLDPAQDAADWNWAVEKALGLKDSIIKAEELEVQMKEDAKNADENKESQSSLPDIEEVLKQAEEAEKDLAEGKTEADKAAAKAATEAAAKKAAEAEEAKVSHNMKPEDIPQLVFLHRDANGKPLTTKDGSTILHCIPGQVNRKKVDNDTHANCFAFYLERKFERSSEERMTVVVDTRPGDGWPNPAAIMMVNFVRRVAKVLQGLYPERCERLIVYPLPRIAVHVWSAVRVFMQKDIADKVVLASGPAGRDSPIPEDELLPHIDGAVLEKLDAHHKDTFVKLTETQDV